MPAAVSWWLELSASLVAAVRSVSLWPTAQSAELPEESVTSLSTALARTPLAQLTCTCRMAGSATVTTHSATRAGARLTSNNVSSTLGQVSERRRGG